jgi:hypothetical protein
VYVINTRIGKYAFHICPLAFARLKWEAQNFYGLCGRPSRAMYFSSLLSLMTCELHKLWTRTSVAIQGSRDESVPQFFFKERLEAPALYRLIKPKRHSSKRISKSTEQHEPS